MIVQNKIVPFHITDSCYIVYPFCGQQVLFDNKIEKYYIITSSFILMWKYISIFVVILRVSPEISVIIISTV